MLKIVNILVGNLLYIIFVAINNYMPCIYNEIAPAERTGKSTQPHFFVPNTGKKAR